MQIFSGYNIFMDSQEQDKVGSSSISLACFVRKVLQKCNSFITKIRFLHLKRYLLENT